MYFNERLGTSHSVYLRAVSMTVFAVYSEGITYVSVSTIKTVAIYQ